jgi:hypothetical protein
MITLATTTAADMAKGVTPMADDEQSTSGMVSSMAQVFVSQLRTVTEGLENLAGFGERLPSDRGPLLLPGALSAAQVSSIADSVAAQRRSIEALKAQLSAFDEQLAVLEQILGPFAEWSRSWADLEKQLVNMRRSPEAEDSLSPLPFCRSFEWVSSGAARHPDRPLEGDGP